MADTRAMPGSRSLASKATLGVAALGVLALVVLIARELTPHHATVAADVPRDPAPLTLPAPLEPERPSPPVVTAIGHAAVARLAPVAPPEPTAAPASEVPSPAMQIAAITENPRLVRPTNVIKSRNGKGDTFAYDTLPPFRGAEVTRDKANPKAWEVNGAFGPKLEELGPAGAVKEAIVQKDDQGAPFATWYSVDSGPLAPAFATKIGEQVRVVSRAYLEANRPDFPASVGSLLDK